MVRLNAAFLSADSLPSFRLDLHDLLLDDMHLATVDHAFVCSSTANLPQAVGVASTNTATLKYSHKEKVR